MNYFPHYQQIVKYVLKHQITSINQLLSTTNIAFTYLNDFEEEMSWIDHCIDATFALELRTVLLRQDLPYYRNKLALLHEASHILLGHKGNFKLSCLPQSGSLEEHEANMSAYCLLLLFRFYETSEIRYDFEEIADTYGLSYCEIDNLIEAHQFVNSLLSEKL